MSLHTALYHGIGRSHAELKWWDNRQWWASGDGSCGLGHRVLRDCWALRKGLGLAWGYPARLPGTWAIYFTFLIALQHRAVAGAGPAHVPAGGSTSEVPTTPLMGPKTLAANEDEDETAFPNPRRRLSRYY